MNKQTRHRVSVNVTHEISQQYNEPKVTVVPASTASQAEEAAKLYFARMGYKVNSTNYLGLA